MRLQLATCNMQLSTKIGVEIISRNKMMQEHTQTANKNRRPKHEELMHNDHFFRNANSRVFVSRVRMPAAVPNPNCRGSSDGLHIWLLLLRVSGMFPLRLHLRSIFSLFSCRIGNAQQSIKCPVMFRSNRNFLRWSVDAFYGECERQLRNSASYLIKSKLESKSAKKHFSFCWRWKFYCDFTVLWDSLAFYCRKRL